MKAYIKPSMETGDVSMTEMLAASLPVVTDKTVPGSAALTKPNNWDIFGEDEDDAED